VSKNVAVFVDVANIFYAAKAAGVDIDYVTLLKSASAGRDLVRAYAYTGLDPENENQRNFHDFLRRHGYRVVSKDIRKYGDGKVKANLDIELVVDMMKTARNLDIAIVVSGDGDFAPAIRAVQEQGVRVEVISFRGNTSSDLIDVADQFTDITSLAKVERDSTRSGRRVADDEHDLSMTEVPDKLTEGVMTGRSRGGRGRGRGRAAEPAAAGTRRRAESTARSASAAAEAAASGGPAAAERGEPAGLVAAGGSLVAMPGEKLSRAASGAPAAMSQMVDELEDEGALAAFGPERSQGPVEELEGEAADAGAPGEAGRRRRRRGGRGRGRGRGAGEGATETYAGGPISEDDRGRDYSPRPAAATAFGSVWDSQIGTPSRGAVTPPTEDEDFEEPAIPEYLIAERRQRGAAGGRGARGGRGGRGGAYASFVERERFGRGGGGGINRYPDVSGRDRGPRDSGPVRDDRMRTPFGGSSEPWSEVPPELEALLRAQLAGRPRSQGAAPATAGGAGAGGPTARGQEAGGAATPAARGAGSRGRRDRGRPATTPAEATLEGPTGVAASASPIAEAPDAVPGARPRGRRPVASTESADDAALEATASGAGPKPTRRRSAGTTRATSVSGADRTTSEAAGAGSMPAEPARPAARPARRTAAGTKAEAATTRAPRSPKAEGKPEADAERASSTRRRTAAGRSMATAPATSESNPDAAPAPRRRTPRKAAETPPA
jgi:uncharacterized LabA/DUF88 family protein